MATKSIDRNVGINVVAKSDDGSFNKVRAQYNSLLAEIKKLEIGSEAYNDKVRELRQVGEVIEEHKKSIRGVEGAWDKISSTLSGAVGFGGVAGIVATVTQSVIQFGAEMVNQAKEFINMRTEVSKLTGLQGEQLDEYV